MRVLFIHPSFPGPFRHLAAHFGAMSDTTVLFLSERNRKEVRLPGVRRLTISAPQNLPQLDDAEKEALLGLRRGANVANALLHLQRTGFRPDIICSSSGVGSNFYISDIFPDAFRVVYADWFYTKGVNHTFFNHGKPRSPAEFAVSRVRNLYQLNALTDCNLAITSTQWQKKQYPAQLSASITVQHEGVDTEFFSPNPGQLFSVPGCDLSHVEELVTFSGRSMESFRGFPQFCRGLPRLLGARPRCHVLIMASEQASRSGEGRSNPLEFLESLPEETRNRVHFLGFRPYEEYRSLLRASTVHVYLTAPFALSSGLLEALSCGCLLVGSDTEPVREVVRHGQNGFLCDYWNPDMLADMTIWLLERSKAMREVRESARQTILEHYDLQTLGPRNVEYLLDNYRNWVKKDR